MDKMLDFLVGYAESGSAQPESLFPYRIRNPRVATMALPSTIEVVQGDDLFDTIQTGSDAISGSRGLYIHIPYCDRRCTFCMYTCYDDASQGDLIQYTTLLMRQLEKLAESAWIQAAPFDAIYLGGGTPTVLPPETFAYLVSGIRKLIPIADDCEITVESTLTAMNDEVWSVLPGIGVNRVSFGVQTFDTSLRRRHGRRSSKEEVVEMLQKLTSSGIRNIAIDLIYTLEGHSREILHDDLLTMASLPVTGLSLYPLIKGDDKLVTQEKLKAEYTLYMHADAFIRALPGWTRFTPVQYGDAQNGRARYVQMHGLQQDILAVGPSAGGRIASYGYLHNRRLREWVDNASHEKGTIERCVQYHPNVAKYQPVFKLSESHGITQQEIELLKPLFGEVFSMLLDTGLITHDGDTLRVTPDGAFWAGNLSVLFAQHIAEKA